MLYIVLCVRVCFSGYLCVCVCVSGYSSSPFVSFFLCFLFVCLRVKQVRRESLVWQGHVAPQDTRAKEESRWVFVGVCGHAHVSQPLFILGKFALFIIS